MTKSSKEKLIDDEKYEWLHEQTMKTVKECGSASGDSFFQYFIAKLGLSENEYEFRYNHVFGNEQYDLDLMDELGAELKFYDKKFYYLLGVAFRGEFDYIAPAIRQGDRVDKDGNVPLYAMHWDRLPEPSAVSYGYKEFTRFNIRTKKMEVGDNE